MALIKDKIITAESLKALHDYDKETYETKENVNILNENIKEALTKITLENLLASGATVLSSYQYGDELPEAGTVGRIFFKRLTDLQ